LLDFSVHRQFFSKLLNVVTLSTVKRCLTSFKKLQRLQWTLVVMPLKTSLSIGNVDERIFYKSLFEMVLFDVAQCGMAFIRIEYICRLKFEIRN
jgi:hypothetical protein